MNSYVGEYSVREGFTCTVTRGDDGLILAVTGQPPIPLQAESEKLFFTTLLNTTVSFETSVEGQVTGLTLQQAGQSTPAARQA